MRTWLVAVAGLLIAGCGADRGMEPVQDAGTVLNQRAGKLAIEPRATVRALVTQDGAPVNGVTVEFGRSVSGRTAESTGSGTTDGTGRATVELEAESGDIGG